MTAPNPNKVIFKKYPLEQQVNCAYCGTEAVRIVTSRVKSKGLYFCDIECKLNRRTGVLAGIIPKIDQSPLCKMEDRFDVNWGDLKKELGPRKDINDMRQPTKYDHEYGSPERYPDEPRIISRGWCER